MYFFGIIGIIFVFINVEENVEFEVLFEYQKFYYVFVFGVVEVGVCEEVREFC